MKASSTNCKGSRLRPALLAMAALSLVLPLLSCALDANPERKRIELAVGPVTFMTEIAKTDQERQTGLMYRTRLADDQAMLFIFEKDQNLRFWMKNTRIPLSIAYIDASGKIREIHDMEPESLAGIESRHAVRYALEVPQGAFGRRGVKVGDIVDLSPIR